MKTNLVCEMAIIAYAMTGCGLSVKDDLMQGSGATGLYQGDETRNEADELPSMTPELDEATASELDEGTTRDRLRYTVRYQARTRSLDFLAWISSVNPIPGTEMPGDLTADGVPLTLNESLGTSYSASIDNIDAAEQITTELTYENDGPMIRDNVTLKNISIESMEGEVSVSQGISVNWSGMDLTDGDQIEIRMRRPNSKYEFDFRAWGQKGILNTHLWIDGDTFRVQPPHNGLNLVAGEVYELWLWRSRTSSSNPRLYSATYESDVVKVTVVP